MWTAPVKNNSSFPFMTPQPPSRKSRISGNSPAPTTPYERKTDPFHVVHKVPSGDSPYVKAKHVQLIDKEPSKAVALFWAAINAGDRVDSALKDMAIVMKQLDRSDEAIEAIKSFRHLCPYDSQDSIDNVLIELYKRAGRIEEEIEMLQRKLKRIEEGAVFNGRRTKTARSQGKKVQVTIHQERSRVLGNLGWAYMQLEDYKTAKELYRKALILEADNNKQCNLAICLMHMNRIAEAEAHLLPVMAYAKTHCLDESCAKSFDRALQLLSELKSKLAQDSVDGRSFLPYSLECRTSSTGGRGYVHGAEAHEKLNNRQDAQVKLLKRGFFCQDYQHTIDGDVWQNEANFNYALCTPQIQQSSPQSNSREKGFSLEKLEKKDKTLCEMQESSSSSAQAEVFSVSRKSHAPKRRNFNVPPRQPRQYCWESKIGCERRDTWTENVGRNLSRKLCFEESFPSDSSQLSANNEDPKLIDTDRSIVAMKESNTIMASPHTMCRDMPRGGFGQLQHAVGEVNSRVSLNGNLGRNSWRENRCAQDKNEAEKRSQSKWGKQQMLNTTHPVDKTGVSQTSVYSEIYHCSDESAPGNMGLKDIVEEIWSEQDHNGNTESFLNPQATMPGKSWADLVEEEERELSVGKNECCNGDIYQEALNPMSKHFESLGFVEEFKDENRDLNISESAHFTDQDDYLNQKRLELLDLVDEQSTAQTAVSSRKSTAKRSINFSQPADSFCLSPCLKNSEKNSSLPCSKTNFASAKCAQPKRKHRLQVFRDITPQPESPGA